MVESRTRFRRYQLRDKTLEWGTIGWACLLKNRVPPHTLVYHFFNNKSSLFIIFFVVDFFYKMCLAINWCKKRVGIIPHSVYCLTFY